MRSGSKRIKAIIEDILAGSLPYRDNVVIGDNSSGKTLLLKLFIERARDDENVYFIDAVNRGFDVKKVSRTEKKPEYKRTILDTRLQEAYFNLADSFNCFGTFTERIEMIYPLYEQEVQRLFYELTDERFQILYGDLSGEVDLGGYKGLLSSGYQALIRILLELLYYQDMAIEKRHMEYAWIVIDELDEFLSPRYAAVILNFLKRNFPWARWIVTTHSCDLVAHTKDAALIVLENDVCEVIDINDHPSVAEVQIIFERLFGTQARQEPQIENVLRRLLNNKMNHAWGTEDEECLEQIKKRHLPASQQVIIRQIQEW